MAKKELNRETEAELNAREEESSVAEEPTGNDFRVQPGIADSLGVVTNPDPSPEDLVHDEQGNVRAEFAPLGVGEVTAEDVIRSGRFELRRREDGEYDAYDVSTGNLVAVGVSADPAVMAKYSR